MAALSHPVRRNSLVLIVDLNSIIVPKLSTLISAMYSSG
jgi:hypothetical protein